LNALSVALWMAKQQQKGKWTKRRRRELSPSVERTGHRRRASPRGKEPLASEKRRELSRSSSPSIEKKGHRRRASPRAKEPLASEKRRELSRSRIRKPKGRPARSTKKRKEDDSAPADSHAPARFTEIGKIIIDMLFENVTRDECIDICYYVVNGPASDAQLTGSKSKHPTEARGSSARAVPGSSARAVPRKRPRKQPVLDETSSSSARAVPHTRPKSPTPYYYSSSDSEPDRGETCRKAEGGPVKANHGETWEKPRGDLRTPRGDLRTGEGEAKHGETCEQAKGKDTSIRPIRAREARPREVWRDCKEEMVRLTEPRDAR
jgi:hypothetical protein